MNIDRPGQKGAGRQKAGLTVNEKFFSLPRAKQQSILNAGFHAFAGSSYRRTSCREIAEEAGISKALLFHYFHNKKEFYLFLLDTASCLTEEALAQSGAFEEKDLFEQLRKGILVKIGLMRRFPDMGTFSLKAFYEKDEEVFREIRERIDHYSDYQRNQERLQLDPKDFRPGIDLHMMYKEMLWASEGYLWEYCQEPGFDIEQVEKDFNRLVGFWRSIYAREDER